MKRTMRIFAILAACIGMMASAASAQPSQLRVKPTADGYEIAGKGFGKDKAKVQVFEGMTQVPAASIISVTDDLIVVRSKPSGMIQHRVTIGNQAATVSFTHIAAQDSTKPVAVTEAAAKPGIGKTIAPGALAGGTVVAGSARAPGAPPALPTLTQSLTTPAVSLTGNRGQSAAAPPPPLPSLTQTLTTPPASLTGNR